MTVGRDARWWRWQSAKAVAVAGVPTGSTQGGGGGVRFVWNPIDEIILHESQILKGLEAQKYRTMDRKSNRTISYFHNSYPSSERSWLTQLPMFEIHVYQLSNSSSLRLIHSMRHCLPVHLRHGPCCRQWPSSWSRFPACTVVP